ncbi:MAG: hypothetical protein ABSA06_05250 [Geobacteraceae bacterium]|jgi:hypothetical protein
MTQADEFYASEGNWFWLAGLAWGHFVWGAEGEEVAEIFMRSTPDGSLSA